MQVMSIVAVKRELEVCYVGIGGKCFEILEDRVRENSSDGAMHSGISGHNNADVDDDDDDDDDDEEEDEEDEEGAPDEVVESDVDDDDEDVSSDEDDGEGAGGMRGDASGQARLRLREILFYDDKVEIFKGRHGKL